MQHTLCFLVSKHALLQMNMDNWASLYNWHTHEIWISVDFNMYSLYKTNHTLLNFINTVFSFDFLQSSLHVLLESVSPSLKVSLDTFSPQIREYRLWHNKLHFTGRILQIFYVFQISINCLHQWNKLLIQHWHNYLFTVNTLASSCLLNNMMSVSPLFTLLDLFWH